MAAQQSAEMAAGAAGQGKFARKEHIIRIFPALAAAARPVVVLAQAALHAHKRTRAAARLLC